MREEMEYRREMNRSYLIVPEIEEEEAGKFRYQMVLRNQIPGILPCSERFPEGRRSLYFDISSRQSLEQLYEGRKLDASGCLRLLSAMAHSLEQAAGYLLDESCVRMNPRFIFTDAREEEIYYLFYPAGGTCEPEYGLLADFLLAHTDHKEETAVDLVYRFYQESKFAYFSLEGFVRSLQGDRVGEPGKTGGMGQADGRRAEPQPMDFPEHRVQMPQGYEEEWDADIYVDQDSAASGERKKSGGKKRLLLLMGILLAGGGMVLRQMMEAMPAGGMAIESYGMTGMPDGGTLPFWIGPVLFGGGLCVVLAGVLLWRKEKERSSGGEQEKAQKGGVFGEKEGAQRQEQGGRWPEWGRQEAEIWCWQDHREGAGEGRGTEDEGNPSYYGSGTGMYHGTGDTWQSAYGEETVFLEQSEEYGGMLEGEEGGRKLNYSLELLPLTVGKMKEKAEILLKDSSVSRIHARFLLAEGRVAVTDLNSRNGTFVNGERLKIGEIRCLKKGDSIRFGRIELRYC